MASWHTVRQVLASRDGRVGVVVVGALVALALFASPWLADPNAHHFGLPMASDGGPPQPSSKHWLGTDALFRDELSRLCHGGRVSLAVGVLGAGLAGTLGTLLGVVAASAAAGRARLLDWAIMRTADALLALPFLLVITALGVLVGRTSPLELVLILTVSGWAGTARVIRARAVIILSEDYVAAARALGANLWSIALRHVLPNVLSTALVLGTGMVGGMILAEAVLGYLTIGLPPPDPTWGRMLHEAETLVATRPLLIAAPGTMIVLSMIGFHRLGEAMARATGQRATPPGRLRTPVDLALVVAGAGLLLLLPSPELAPPAPAAASDTPPERGGTLKIASFHTIRSLDPAIASDELSVSVGRLIYGRLFEIDEQGQLVPNLGRELNAAADGRSFELLLREGVIFHDGTELDAAAVKRSLERALSSQTASASALEFSDLLGFEAFRSGQASELAGLVVTGKHSLRLILSQPNGLLPALLSLGQASVVCPSVPQDVQATSDAALCGAGPFRIKSFEPERGMVLVRHDAYFLPEFPYLDAIEFSFGVRAQTQRYQLERGDLDLVRELSSTDANLVRADARWAREAQLVDSLRVSAIFLNTELPPFDNVHLRRAVSFAIDPEPLAKIRSDLRPLATVVPTSMPGQRRPKRTRTHDPEAALLEMERAGFAFDPISKKGGYPQEIEYLTIPDTFEQAAAEVYVQQLAAIGLRVRLRLVSFQTYLSEVQQRGRVQMGWSGWHADYPDPLTFFEPRLSGRAIAETSQNSSFYRNEELDALLARAKQLLTVAERDALFSRAEEIVAEDAPWVPTSSARVFELKQPYVRGYHPNALISLDFTRTFFAKPRQNSAPQAALSLPLPVRP